MTVISKHRAQEIADGFVARNIAVLGDVMLDEFVWGDVTRISPEGPVPVVDVRRESVHLGGAANVVANLIALGARGSVTGVIGDDRAGERLAAELAESCGSDAASLVVDTSRPTTIKTRIIAHSQLVVRTDRELRRRAGPEIEERLIASLLLELERADALVVSDYDKGAVTPRVLAEVLPFAVSRGIPVLVDPKFRNFDSYKPATLITPNHLEALRFANSEDDSDEGLAEAAGVIRRRLGCEAILITRGERGMMLCESEAPPVFVTTVAREVYDVTGAGDTVIAMLAAAMAAGATTLEAAILANHAAGIVVGKVGTATATMEEVLASLGGA